MTPPGLGTGIGIHLQSSTGPYVRLPAGPLTVLPSWLVHSRASVATYIDSAGVMQTAASGDPVLAEYDPADLSLRGMRNEPVAATQRVKYSKGIGGTGWTNRGSLTVTTNDIVAPDGTTTGTKLEGLNDTGNDDTYQLNGGFANDAPLAMSIWVKQITTSGTIRISNPQTSTKGNWSVNLALLSGSWERLTADHAAVTVTNAFVASATGTAGILIDDDNDGSPDIYVWQGQQTEGEVSSDIFSPDSAAVTRAAETLELDTDTITTIAGSSFTVLIEWEPAFFASSKEVINADSLIRIITSAADSDEFQHDIDGNLGTAIDPGPPVLGDRYAAILTVDTATQYFSVQRNSGPAVNTSSTETADLNFTDFFFLATQAGWIKSLKIWR